MRVLVCGGRGYGEIPKSIPKFTWARTDAGRVAEYERSVLWSTLNALIPCPTAIIEGGATGADRHAREWAEHFGLKPETYKADWYPSGFGRLDRSAGPIRNQRMLDEGRPDLVLAFPGGTGTADMVRRARAAGVKVIEIANAPPPSKDA